MPSTLAEKVAADVSAVLIRTEHFAVGATIWPEGGSARHVELVAQSQPRTTEEEPHHKTERNDVTFLVSSAVTTGYPDPKLGDSLRLDSEPADTRWDFAQIVDSGPGFYLVKFTRRKILRAGQFRPSSL